MYVCRVPPTVSVYVCVCVQAYPLAPNPPDIKELALRLARINQQSTKSDPVLTSIGLSFPRTQVTEPDGYSL